MVRAGSSRTLARGLVRSGRGDLDECGSFAGRRDDRLRLAGRHLHHGRGGWRGARCAHRARVADAAGLLARWPVARLHERRRRRRQHLGLQARWFRGAPSHEGVLPPVDATRMVAGRPVDRRAQALHRAALARRGRDLAVPHLRRRRPAGDDQGQRPKGPRRARVVAGWQAPVLQPGRDARRHLRVLEGLDQGHLPHRSPGARHWRAHHRGGGDGRRLRADAVARWASTGLRASRRLQERLVCARSRFWRGAQGVGCGRARLPRDLGRAWRRAAHGVDQGWRGGPRLERRQDPSHRLGERRGERRAVPRQGHARGRGRGALSGRGRARAVPGQGAALDARRAGCSIGPVPGAGLVVVAAPRSERARARRRRVRAASAASQAAAADEGRALRAFPGLVARRTLRRVHHF